jgi:hypothetical protein
MTKAEYAEHQQAVADFFEREGIANLSSTSNESFFSWSPCQCCGRRRIRPPAFLDEITLAYKVHHLRPIRGFFFIRRGLQTHACPLTALAIHRGIMDGVCPGLELRGGGIDAGAIETTGWAVETFGHEWVTGFLDGFDCKKQAKDDPDYRAGHDLGVAAAQQLCPRDPVI